MLKTVLLSFLTVMYHCSLRIYFVMYQTATEEKMTKMLPQNKCLVYALVSLQERKKRMPKTDLVQHHLPYSDCLLFFFPI